MSTSRKGECRTIVYIHGIGIGQDKGPAGVKSDWDNDLFKEPHGERTRMAYWASRILPAALSPGELRTSFVSEAGGTTPSQEQVSSYIARLTDRPERARALEEVARQLLSPSHDRARGGPGDSPLNRTRAYEWIPQEISYAFTKLFLREVHDFLYIQERRDAMKRVFRERILAGGGPFLVIAHSLGSAIALDALRSRDLAGADIRLFVTLGSPIALGPIKEYFESSGGLRRPDSVKKWLNVSSPLDVVAVDHELKDDFGNDEAITDLVLTVDGEPHAVKGYLQLREVRHAVYRELDTALFQFVAPVAIVRNLSEMFEDAGDERIPVLIELSDDSGSKSGDLESRRDETLAAIRQVAPNVSEKDLNLRLLNRYVAADLTRFEAEKLASSVSLDPSKPPLAFHRLWHNSTKRALLLKSAHTVQAAPAHSTYGAEGMGIRWAVLDTGCDTGHPHFQPNGSIQEEVDCTGRFLVRGPGSANDEHGHGTHVAGVIAGESATDTGPVRSIAPKTKLHIYKVLREDGSGDDASIIMALDDIVAVNERHGGVYIHGVNISLGGRFEPSVFGCGFSPLCNELRRLWTRGVLVVIAAGNEGYITIEGRRVTIEANMPLSIGDPANLDEAIAVGSTHKERPHLYGTSFFSSRGPTADGRQKPDLVAPGEKISSCRAGGRGNVFSDLYVDMSGTSMAAPHVSGLLAAFLSARIEFLGFPQKVKHILLENCTDLGRVKEHQGAGLPNLVRMLLNT